MKARQNPLSKVESFMQRIVESPFAFLFPSKLQPAEIARKLEHAMEDGILLQGEGRRLAPEIYDIFLSYKDHQQLLPVETTLKKGWQDHLVQVARQHHYTLRTMPVLRLHASSELRPGMVAILPALPQAWLTIRLPQMVQKVYRIEKPVVNIGRQLTNDIIVEDKRVSRYHAQIKYQPNSQFIIFDLGSTNGITINGTPHLRQHTLRNGDRFTIGSYDFYFERR